MLTAVSASGCFRVSRAVRDLPEGDWAVRLGDAGNAAYIDERVPGTVRTQWSADFGRGMAVAPIIQEDFLLTAVSGGVIVTASASSGDRYWTRRFNGPIAGQVVRVGTRIYFATQHRSGTLYAIDLERGRRQWSRRIGSPASSQLVFDSGRIYVGTNRDVQAIDAANGNVIWRARIGGAAVQPPVVHRGELLLAYADTLFRLALDDGAINARVPLPGAPSAPFSVRGDTIVIAMHPGLIAAYVDAGERELWRHTLDAPVLAAPVIADDGVFALTRTAGLYHVERGSIRRIAALDGAATESFTMTADGALIGTLDGRLIFVRRDGTVAWEERFESSVRAPAVVHGSDIYVGTLDGVLVKLVSG